MNKELAIKMILSNKYDKTIIYEYLLSIGRKMNKETYYLYFDVFLLSNLVIVQDFLIKQFNIIILSDNNDNIIKLL